VQSSHETVPVGKNVNSIVWLQRKCHASRSEFVSRSEIGVESVTGSDPDLDWTWTWTPTWNWILSPIQTLIQTRPDPGLWPWPWSKPRLESRLVGVLIWIQVRGRGLDPNLDPFSGRSLGLDHSPDLVKVNVWVWIWSVSRSRLRSRLRLWSESRSE